jgi:hypothetical protein
MISHGDKEAFGQGYGKGPGASDTGWEPNDLGFGYSVSKDPDGADPKESGERPLSQRRKDHSTTKVRKGSRLAAYDGGTGGPSDDMGPAMEPEDEGPVSVEAPPAPAPPPPSTIKFCPFCLASETRILTFDGPVAIGDVVGTRQLVLTNQGFDRRSGYWVEAKIESFGEHQLWEIEVSRNKRRKVIRATAEHQWFVKSSTGGTFTNSNGKSQSLNSRNTHRIVTTENLRPGHGLSSLFPQSRVLSDEITLSKVGAAQGATFGDGTAGRGGHLGGTCDLWGDKVELLHLFPADQRTAPVKSHLGALGVQVRGIPKSWKDAPDLNESLDFLYGWLAGYVATDGAVSKQGQVTLSSSRRENLELVQRVANRLGIAYFDIHGAMRTGCKGRGLLHNSSMERYGKCSLEEPRMLYEFEFVGSSLREDFFLRAEQRSRYLAKNSAYERLGWTVRSVKATNQAEEVFCAVVPGTESFALEGNIWTHNCSSAGVVGRSDGSISCSYCSQCFSVEQRNPFPFMPGEEPGVAGEAPVGDGAPFGDDQDPGAGDEDPDASEGDTEAEEDGDWPTDDGDEDDGDDDGSEAAGADDDVPPQFRRKSFRTREGAVLSRRNYLRRVAFVVSRDPYVTMAEMERRRSGDSLSVDRA